MKFLCAIVAIVGALSACQQTPINRHTSDALRCRNTASAFDCDRAAILAMAGEYAVDFHFEETAALRAGYEKKPAHNSKAQEWVFVVEDSGAHIVLQHILVSDKAEVTKHWRQDWDYQPSSTWEFSGTQKAPQWRRTTANAEQRHGAWLQTVWHVDDSPRYASLGRWQHRSNLSRWSGDTTRRPLPRREYTTRHDYDVLLANNRHEITPTGWVHAQDNIKWDSNATDRQHAVAREIGVNTYTRVANVDFSPAHKYWQQTHQYWSLVRAKWQLTLAQHGEFSVRDKIDEMTMWLTLSAAADETVSDSLSDQQKEIDEIFSRYLVAAPLSINAATVTLATVK